MYSPQIMSIANIHYQNAEYRLCDTKVGMKVYHDDRLKTVKSISSSRAIWLDDDTGGAAIETITLSNDDFRIGKLCDHRLMFVIILPMGNRNMMKSRELMYRVSHITKHEFLVTKVLILPSRGDDHPTLECINPEKLKDTDPERLEKIEKAIDDFDKFIDDHEKFLDMKREEVSNG